MSDTNPIFRTPKTRRLVSAWTVRKSIDHALARVQEFQDIFDQVIFMCGHVQPDSSLPDQWPAEERKAAIGRFREMGVSVLNDYAGNWEKGFRGVAQSPELIWKLIHNIVADCEYTGADGVDIDLESMPAEARFPYTQYLTGLSEELHRRNRMLSVCTGATLDAYRRDWGIGFIDVPTVSHYVDHVRAMCYDLFSPGLNRPGPTSIAPWVRDQMEYMVQEVPRHKIIAGLPMYSVDWNMVDDRKSFQVHDCRYLEEKEKLSPIGRAWIPYWDVSLIRYTDGDGAPHLLYVSDAKSTKSNLVVVDDLDLAGVCFWCLIAEDPRIWETVREHFRRW